MSKFTDYVQQDTPRLVVTFKRDRKGDEVFQWGIVGQIPLLTLVGAITRVQADIHFRAPEECPEPAFVITWDAVMHELAWYIHPDVPVDPLVGMLETIKATIVASIMRNHAAQQPQLYGPDGQPYRR